MRKQGTILSPKCKEYANEIELLTNVPQHINLQYLRIIESLVCHNINEELLNVKNNMENNENEELPSITVELPLLGNLTIIPKLWHHNHLRTGKPSIHYEFAFEPFPAFKTHISKIYAGEDCEMVSLLSDTYSKMLVNTYKNIMELEGD